MSPAHRVLVVNAFTAAPDKTDFVVKFARGGSAAPAPAHPGAHPGALPPAAAGVLPVAPLRTKMQVDRKVYRERKVCAAIIIPRNVCRGAPFVFESRVCGYVLKSALSVKRGFCPTHYRRIQIELDKECRETKAKADRLKESMSTKSMRACVMRSASKLLKKPMSFSLRSFSGTWRYSVTVFTR